MERGAAVRLLRLAVAVLALAVAAPAPAGERQVVLVVNADSPVTQLDPIEIRKLFLGLPVLRQGRKLLPVHNASDRQLNQVFLQHVVAMSQSAYDRHVLAQVLQQGRPRPLELTSRQQVLTTLYADRHAVSYVWLQDVARDPRIRILRVLWTE